MPRTSTAERHDYICPLCDRPLARDVDQQGWVRHADRPDIARLLADPAKLALMSEDDRRFLEFDGICPFELGEKDDVEPPTPRFQYLEPRQGSNYRQWFVKGRRIRAEVLYRQTIGPEPRSLEEVASDFDLPVELIREAIEYCLHNAQVLEEDDLAGDALVARIKPGPPSSAAEVAREV